MLTISFELRKWRMSYRRSGLFGRQAISTLLRGSGCKLLAVVVSDRSDRKSVLLKEKGMKRFHWPLKAQSRRPQAPGEASSVRRGKTSSFVLFGTILLVMLAQVNMARGNIPGDANGDGVVDTLDLATVTDNWNPGGGVVGGAAVGGFNGDGYVDFLDFQTIINNYTYGVNVQGTNVSTVVFNTVKTPVTIAGLGYMEYDVYATANAGHNVRAIEGYFSGPMLQNGVLVDDPDPEQEYPEASHLYRPDSVNFPDQIIDAGLDIEYFSPNNSLLLDHKTGIESYLGTEANPFVLGIMGDSANSVDFAHLVVPEGDSVYFSGHVVSCSDPLGQDFQNVDVTTLPDLGAAVPEPLTILAVGMGIAGLGGYIRRRRMVAK
jgi:hypothetical protein